MEVTSELYDENTFQKVTRLNDLHSLVSLKFFDEKSSNGSVDVDEDGDLIVPRKNLLSIEIEFSRSTVIPLVGLQIWRGAFVLADYILSSQKVAFENKVVLELAAGVGFTSIVASLVAKEVICTDIENGGILDLIRRNFDRNKRLMKGSSLILPLDFYQEEFGIDLQRKLNETDVIIAADVIYDNKLSEAFVHTLTKILKIPPKKTFYMSLEKRYVFAVDSLDVEAPCFGHFLRYLKSFWSSTPVTATWKIEEVNLDFEQKFDYERTKHMVLLKMST